MKHFILVTVIVVLLVSCAFFLPVPPQVPAGVQTVVMWCDTEGDYTEWEVREDYFFCTGSGTVWHFAD